METTPLRQTGAHFIAGHFDCPSPSPMLKYAAGVCEVLTSDPLCIDPARRLAPVDRLIRWPGPMFNGLVQFNLVECQRRPQWREFAQYWREYDVDYQVEQALDAQGRRIFAFNGFSTYQHLFSVWQGHATLDYRTIVREGLPWYRQQIDKRLQTPHGAATSGDAGQREFFLAVSTVMSGVEAVLQRYAKACEEYAGTGAEGNRGAMRDLAAGFRQFLVGPPRGFFEALLLVHFMNALDGFDNVGRLDQYLHPFYIKDIRSGVLSEDQAQDLLVETFDIWGACDHWQVVVGGTDRDGKDASNELTRLILKARARVRRPKPSVSLRWSTKSPPDLLEAAMDLLAQGVGQPALYNDDLYIDAWQRIGVPHEDAVEFVFGGCSETHIAGKSAARDAFLNIVKAMEAVFYDGRVSRDGPRFGLQTGPPEQLPTFEAFLAAYKRQAQYLVDTFVRYRNVAQEVIARCHPALVRSIFVQGCLESGVSNTAGGSKYDYGMIDVYGLPNVANSLLAVRRLVYDQNRASMAELADALATNFEGRPDLRAVCLDLPKYGNDLDEVDAIAADIAEHLFEHILRQRIWNGDGYYAFCASSPGAHVMFGQTTGATPDGRLAGTPLANSMGPMQGTDLRGPTAMLKSVAKLPLWKCLGTPVVNLSVRPDLVAGGQRHAVTALVRSFFAMGGMQLQLNIVERDTLIDAMKRPQEHRSLIVRVSGFSARFTDLPAELQEEIVSRTVH